MWNRSAILADFHDAWRCPRQICDHGYIVRYIVGYIAGKIATYIATYITGRVLANLDIKEWDQTCML